MKQWKNFGIAVIVVFVMCNFSWSQDAPESHGSHWSYAGKDGPAHWGELQPEFAECQTGQHQSPIDIEKTTKSDLPALKFHYSASPLTILDNGHTIVINYAPGSTVTIGDKSYELKLFHFHHPSEEQIRGKHSEMVIHLVHQDSEGHLAVVAVLLEAGKSNSTIETLWKNLPTETEKEKPRNVPGVMVDANELLPSSLGYYTFPGSLTTPPCTEGVTWYVLKQPVYVSKSQIVAFAKIYANNARPMQPLHERTILETNYIK